MNSGKKISGFSDPGKRWEIASEELYYFCLWPNS